MTGLDAYLDQITENGKIILAVYQRFLSQLTWEMLVGKKGPVNFKLGSEKKKHLYHYFHLPPNSFLWLNESLHRRVDGAFAQCLKGLCHGSPVHFV